MSEGKRGYQWIWRAVCVAAVVIGGLYYFGILNAFVPNTEDLGTVQHWYLILKMGQPYRHINIIYDAVSCLSVLAGGMSYFSIRLIFTLLYMMVLGLSLFLSAYRSKSNKQWFVFPLWTFFMVLVRTVREGSRFARVYEDTDLIYQLPYCYHITSLIFALICMVILQCYMNTETGKKKGLIGGLGIVIGIYACLSTDLVYYVVFAAPFLLVLVIRGFYHNKTRSYMLPVLAVCVGVMLLTRVLPGDFFAGFWKTETVGNPYGNIYGGSDWLNIGDILSHCVNYLKVVMALFNVEISNRPVISLHSLLLFVRIVLIVFGYAIVGKILICSIKGKIERCGFTIIDEILAWSFTVMSCVFIFTKNGVNESLIRYFPALVPLLTILLCRNIGGCIKGVLPVLEKINYKRYYFSAMIGALCICQAEPVWQYHVEDSYQEDCEAAIEYLRMWGVESDGYALAPYWLCSRLSVMTEGEILFFNNEQLIRDIYGEDAVARYVVVGWEDALRQSYAIVEGTDSYEEWIEGQEASLRRAVDLDHFYVCEFAEQGDME